MIMCQKDSGKKIGQIKHAFTRKRVFFEDKKQLWKKRCKNMKKQRRGLECEMG